MSLIHEALKKAETEKKPTEGIQKPLATNPIVADKKFAPNKTQLLAIGMILSLGLLVYFRFIKQPSASKTPQPIKAIEQPTDPNSPLAIKNQAIQLFKENKLNESLALWEKLTLLAPTDADVYNNMGLVYKKMGKRDDAFQAYDKALALNKNYPEVLNNIGVLHLQENKTKQAKEKFEQAILTKPAYADPYFNYALVLEREGNFKEASRNYKEFLKRTPNIEEALKQRIETKIKRLEK